jgi:polysaccharide biosynthesis protein VpsM
VTLALVTMATKAGRFRRGIQISGYVNTERVYSMRHVGHVVRIIIITAAVSFSNHLHALEPANIPVGPAYVTPKVEVEHGYSDNIFRTASDEESSWYVETVPEVELWMPRGPNNYSLGIKTSDYGFSSSEAENFRDDEAELNVHHEFNSRNAVNVKGEYFDGHEEPGTGLAEGELARQISDPIQLEKKRYKFDYTFGNRDSKGRLEIGYGREDWEYKNYRDLTRYRDRDQDVWRGVFFWKVAPRTDILAEVRRLTVDYNEIDVSDTAGSYDSEEYNYFLGMTWEPSAKMAGSVRMGEYDRDFDSSGREDDSGYTWEMEVTYKPRTYSTFAVGTRRVSEETNGKGDYINSSEVSADWDHDWNSRVTTSLNLGYADDDYEGSGREDDRWKLEATYNYNMRPSLDLGVGYRREDRGSSDFGLDYDLSEVFFRAKLSL